MGVLDVEAIRSRKEQAQRERAEAVGWCIQALSEFGPAARYLSTPPSGNPDLLKHTFGPHAFPGVWPILRSNSEEYLIQIKFGATLTIAGSFWVEGQPSTIDGAARWIAPRCGYSLDVMRQVIEDALLGESWTAASALRAAS